MEETVQGKSFLNRRLLEMNQSDRLFFKTSQSQYFPETLATRPQAFYLTGIPTGLFGQIYRHIGFWLLHVHVLHLCAKKY